MMTTPLHGTVEYVNIDSLEVHPENPRQGDIGAISTSIAENGWFGTIVAQISSRRVLAGNHRLQAARIAGLATLPVFWVDCDDTQARKILIADNRMSDLASWDEPYLADMLTLLAQQDAIAGTGFDAQDIEDILAAAGEIEKPEREPLTCPKCGAEVPLGGKGAKRSRKR
jgi:ParB-like chromosome segregation protein Spo0J